jgi:hypothetical protein
MKTVTFYPAIALTFLVASVTPAIAQNAPAKQTAARFIEVKKVFGYYDIYLRLPPQERDGFRMVYTVRSRESSARPQLTYVLGNVRIPVQISPNGRVLTMPDANMFANGNIEKAAGQPSGSINLDLEAIVPLARTISVADASNPVNDYAAATRRAGPIGLVAPRLGSMRFVGVASGEAVFPDGRRTPLRAAQGGGVIFTPAAGNMRGATSLVFSNTPTSAEFAR